MHRAIPAALLAAAAAPAWSPACARDRDLEIVVTATRSPEAVARLPARIDVVDLAEIERRSLTSLADAIGPQAVQSGGFGQQASAFLRGANSNHTLALLDGVRLNDAASPAGGYDFGQDALGSLARVEILRGPASALYGSEAIGGVVNAIPRRGGASAFEPFLSIAAGSFDTQALSAGAVGTAARLSYGLSVERFETAGFDAVPQRMATHTGDRDRAHSAAALATARLNLGTASFDLLGRVRTSEAEYDTFSGGAFFDLRADDENLGNEAEQSLWRLGAENRFTQAISVRIEGGQVRTDRSEHDDGDVTGSASSRRDFAEAALLVQREGFSATIGAAYERNAIDTAPQFASPLAAWESQRAALAVAHIDVSESIALMASARLDSNRRFGDFDTYSAGLVYEASSLRLFASVGTGFKAPSLSERYEQSFFNLGNPDLAPEQSRSWELGGDWRFGDAASIGASYYETRITDLIEYRFAELRNVNVGEAEIEGLELRAHAALASWAALRLSYDWTDARNAETGEQLLRRPEHTWRAVAELAPTARTSLVLSWSSVGERTDVTYGDGGEFLSGAGTVDGWGVGAVALTYDLSEKSEFFLRIDNVTDEVYEQPAAFAGPPRSALAGIRARL